MREDLTRLAAFGLTLLEIAAGLVALTLVVVALLGLVRSTWKALARRSTLILPFKGTANAAYLNVILAQQLPTVERAWLALSEQLRREQEAGVATDSPAFVPLPPASVEVHLSEEQIEIVRDDPLEGQPLVPVRFAGLTFSPEVLFSLLHRLRTLVARRTITGTMHEFGNAVRVAAAFTNRRRTELTVVVRSLPSPGEILATIDDTAFAIAKLRLVGVSEATSWEAYRSFLEGYVFHLRFIRSGHVRDRDKAIDKYRVAVAAEPLFTLAHYNLGTLLYNRYEAHANREAVEHFSRAATADDEKVEALALAGLALAYCQQGHRYGEEARTVALLADEASSRAIAIRDDLEETCFARAFSLQMTGRIDDAIDWYEKVVLLPGQTSGERRIKSFASANQGFLHLTEREDLAAAESSFARALELFAYNQMAYANLGEIYRRREEYDAAIAAFRHALSIDPTYVNAMNELGGVHVWMAAGEGDPTHKATLLAAAREWHERALAIVPEAEVRQRAEVHERIGRTYDQCGFSNEAGREFAEAETLRAAALTVDSPI